MSQRTPQPGVTRDERISGEGLQRLEKHLQHGARISKPVLAQWIRRYGEPARDLLKRYGLYTPELESGPP